MALLGIDRVRRNFRKEIARVVKNGRGDEKYFLELADGYFCHGCGFMEVKHAFLSSEVADALKAIAEDTEKQAPAYPPDMQEQATATVLEQAEALSMAWTSA
jgi:hypothetical protein